MKTREWTTLSLLVLFVLWPTFAMIDYCGNHTFDIPTDMEVLHFSKENSDREFGIYDKFKCLHCCSHGYRSIEWFKDDQPYPWSTDVSTLIIHPESSNQTICSQQSTPVDSGKYWCIARNDTHFLRHEVSLQISGPSISMGWPKTTYAPRDQTACVGEAVRFYCEAFVGTIDLPDFQSEITWERYDLNRSFIDGKRVIEDVVFREEKRILGSYLYFKAVRAQDYGEYTCKVRNLGDQVVKLSAWLKTKKGIPPERRSESDRKNFFLFFFFLCLLIVIASVTSVCLLRLAFLKIIRNRVSQSSNLTDDSKKDILVIYHESDEKEVWKIISQLQTRSFCSYSLYSLQRESQLGEEDLKAKANSFRTMLVVMSPHLVGGLWTCEAIFHSVQRLLKIHFTVICIFLKALPTAEADSAEWLLLKNSLTQIQFIEKSNGNTRLKFLNLLKRKFSLKKKEPTLRGSSQSLI